MIEILQNNPLLLLFVVAGIGYPLGRLRLGGVSLGVSAVLFAGLAIGGLDPNLKIPESIYTLGLVLFVYSIGLSNGAMFFSSLRQKGIIYNLLVVSVLVIAAIIAVIVNNLFKLGPTLTSGLFAGSLTNTPALAAVIEQVKIMVSQGTLSPNQSDPVVAYSLTYPIGVLGMILAIYFLQRIWKVDYAIEAQLAKVPGVASEPLNNRTILVTQFRTKSVQDLMRQHRWNVIFGRMRHEGQTDLVQGNTILNMGDLVNLVGTLPDLDTVTRAIGVISSEHLEFDLSQYDKRRIFVSNPDIAGRRLHDLDLIIKHEAIVTRLRRGDMELLPNGNTTLMLGDSLRVVAPRDNLEQIAKLFGDSYRGISEVDILTFSLGLALGLLLGMLPIPLPGGLTLTLGTAGGPLIVSLILGGIGRIGPMTWQIPYSVSQTLRQIGLVIFLAGVGTRSGYAFLETFSKNNGLLIFFLGAGITCLTALLTLVIGYRIMKIPMGLLIGMLAGLQTQPAVLAFGLEQTNNELPNIGYATVYPAAMITKIFLAQLLISFLK